MRKLWIVMLVLLSVALFSCTKESNEVSENKKDTTQKNSWGITAGGMEFKVEYNTPRRVYSIDNKDLDNDGDDEIIVLSVDKDEAGDQYMDYYNFDMIQVFTMDSARKKCTGAPQAERIADRAEAILQALLGAAADDVVVLAGKGHENYQEVEGVRRPYSDIEQARGALSAWRMRGRPA